LRTEQGPNFTANDIALVMTEGIKDNWETMRLLNIEAKNNNNNNNQYLNGGRRRRKPLGRRRKSKNTRRGRK
jgi:hypothetical protein